MGPKGILQSGWLKLSLIALSFLMASPAYAVRDWNLTEETDTLLASPVCRAWTNVVRVENLSIELSTSFPKGGEKFPAVYVKVLGLEVASPQALVKLSSRVSQPLFLLKEARVEGEPDIYWYAPTDQDKLVDLIARANTLDLVFSPEGVSPIKASVSLKGSSATLTATLGCVKTEEFQPREFLSFMNTEIGFLTLPAGATSQELFDQVQVTYQDFRKQKILKENIELNAKDIARLKRAESQAQTAFIQSDSSLVGLETELLDKQQKLLASQSLIPTLQQDVVAMASIKTQAQTIFNQKKAVFDPLKNILAPFEDAANDYQNQVNNITRMISSAQKEIADLEAGIVSYTQESSSLESKTSRLEASLEPLRRQKRDLENQIAFYNVDRAYNEIISNDRNYRRIQRDIETLQLQRPSLIDQLRRAEFNTRQAEQAFELCRNAPPAPGEPADSVGPVIEIIGEIFFPGGGFGDFSPGGGRCGVERQAVQQSRRELQQAQNNLDQFENSFSQMRQRLEQIEDEAMSQAQEGRRNLNQQLSQVERQIDQARDSIANNQNRIRDISTLITNNRAEIRSLKSSSFDYDRQLTAAKRALATAMSDLAQKKVSIGYEAIFTQYENARTALSTATRNAQKAEDLYSKELANAETYRVRIAALDPLIINKTAERDQRQIALDQAVLGRVQAEDLAQSLSAELVVTQESLANGRQAYQEMYERLVELTSAP